MEIKKFSIFDTQIQDFIKTHSESLFDTLDWLEVLKEGFNADVSYYALMDNNKIILSISTILLDFKFIKMSYSNIPYGGFIGDKSYIYDFIFLLEKKLKSEGIDILRITKKYNDNFKDFKGYKILSGSQQILNIKGLTEESLWQGYKKRIRRDVRRAEKLGIILKESSNRNDVEILYAIYKETMTRNKTYATWSKKAFYSIYDNLILKGKGVVFLAEINNQCIAGIIILYSKDTAYYFMNASKKDYLSYCPNDLLVHTAITVSIRNGKEYFDFMTSPKNEIELVKFKEKWGSLCYPFYILEKDLVYLKPKIWNFVWAFANSKYGCWILRMYNKLFREK
ncbi:MAG: GNAT family N-acetyltransferase [Candidatus Omnitrophota bacterium]